MLNIIRLQNKKTKSIVIYKKRLTSNLSRSNNRHFVIIQNERNRNIDFFNLTINLLLKMYVNNDSSIRMCKTLFVIRRMQILSRLFNN